jgi:hypothetical protein
LISNKSAPGGLLGDIVYYLDVIIGAVIVCALFIGFVILLLLALFPAAIVCLLITLVGAYGLYKDIKRDRKNTAYNVFTIVIYVIIFLIVVITIGVISTMVI